MWFESVSPPSLLTSPGFLSPCRPVALHSANQESLSAKDQGKLGAIRPSRCPAESPLPGTSPERSKPYTGLRYLCLILMAARLISARDLPPRSNRVRFADGMDSSGF